MTEDAPTRLRRVLTTPDAVVIGLGSMIGAGVFTVFGPAAEVAGTGLLLALAVAAGVAFANALSTAQLAMVHPVSGGAYAYGRARLGPAWGFLAGWGFTVGKTASCAAMALTFGAYAAPSYARATGVAAVIAVTAINLRGVAKTATATRALVAVTLAALAVVVAAGLAGGEASIDNLGSLGDHGPLEVLQAAGLLFFAFAGYARIATLGEEVVDPVRTIGRAIPIALGITLVVYLLVALSALLSIGPQRLAEATAPLRLVVEAGSFGELAGVVRIGAAVAAGGVLLSLVAGVGRTSFAMAAEGDLPRWFAAVHDRHGIPHRTEAAIGLLVAVLVATVDLRDAIGFSSFAVLTYYAVANAAALRLGADERRWPAWVSWAGLGGCVILAATLPLASVIAGLAVLAVGMVAHLVRGWWPDETSETEPRRPPGGSRTAP